jgi:pimeloyl-ACP methyl ester carboxylesterase
MDLLTKREEEAEQFTRHLRFDIPMLAERLGGTMNWLKTQPSTQSARMGIFGASTGGAAAMVAAAEHPRSVRAVVSRGGRPDLAGPALMSLKTPTLLIVGGADFHVIELNSKAYNRMQCVKRMEIVPGATHLFEEPGALERVAELARNWFQAYLR